jgi:hypothetical protein
MILRWRRTFYYALSPKNGVLFYFAKSLFISSCVGRKLFYCYSILPKVGLFRRASDASYFIVILFRQKLVYYVGSWFIISFRWIHETELVYLVVYFVARSSSHEIDK